MRNTNLEGQLGEQNKGGENGSWSEPKSISLLGLGRGITAWLIAAIGIACEYLFVVRQLNKYKDVMFYFPFIAAPAVLFGLVLAISAIVAGWCERSVGFILGILYLIAFCLLILIILL
jgi:hypothetical protein